MVTRAFSKLREGNCRRAYSRELFSQWESTTRPLPAQADCTQRKASAPRRRLYAAKRKYHSASAPTATITSITSRRTTTLPLMLMVRPRLRLNQVVKGRVGFFRHFGEIGRASCRERV